MGYERERTNETLIKHYLNTMRWMSATKEDKEDLAQECRLAIWQEEVRSGAEPDSLDNAFRYVICDRARSDMNRTTLKHTRDHESFDIEMHDHAGSPDAESQAIANEQVRQLAHTDKEEAVAFLVFVHEKTFEFTAEALSIPLPTVQSIVERMRKRAEVLR